MPITDRAEWSVWQHSSDSQSRSQARDALLAEGSVDELLDLCRTPDLETAYAALRLLMHAFVETEPRPEWQTRFPDALRAFIAHSAFFSLPWEMSHHFLDSIEQRHRSFLAEDLAARGLAMEDYQREIDGRRERIRRKVAAMAVPMSAEEWVRGFLASGGSLEQATPEETISWAEDWRSHRSPEALSQLYYRFITCIPERKVPMQILINLLGSPTSGDSSQVYYSINSASGLVLIADSDGFLEGRKLN